MSKETKTKPIKIEWGMKQEMSSLILLLRDGNYDGQQFAQKRLMEIADQIDEHNKIIDQN